MSSAWPEAFPPDRRNGTGGAATRRPLRIAWLGPAPRIDGGGVAGVAALLLEGLAELGHEIDCFFPSAGLPLPPALADSANVHVIWGTSNWQWDRWYSRTRTAAFLSGLIARTVASLRLRQEITVRHKRRPYDLIYQFSTIESPGAPAKLLREVPLVLHPETHSAGELRALLAELPTAARCGQPAKLAASVLVLTVRSLLQRRAINRASLLICISGVFRDHMVRDYRYPRERTIVVPNPVQLERFAAGAPAPEAPPRILVLGRVAARKGIQDVAALCSRLADSERSPEVQIVGGPSLWSDYTPLLRQLPAGSARYLGAVDWSEVPERLAQCDVLLQASRYEPFALTVGEALASGTPIVATSEVGAAEGIDPSVAAVVPPGDVGALLAATLEMTTRAREKRSEIAATARLQAEQHFAPHLVCERISEALRGLLAQRA